MKVTLKTGESFECSNPNITDLAFSKGTTQNRVMGGLFAIYFPQLARFY